MRDIICYDGVEYDRLDFIEKFKGKERDTSKMKDYLVYTKEDLEKQGLPANQLGTKYLEFNGQRYQLYYGFWGDRKLTEPWFGKVALVVDEKKNVNVLNLETGELSYLRTINPYETNHIVPISKDFFVISGTEFGDFRYNIIAKGGFTIDTVVGRYINNYSKDGELTVKKYEGRGWVNEEFVGEITEKELLSRVKIAELNETLISTVEQINALNTSSENTNGMELIKTLLDTVEQMTALGVSKETIESLVSSTFDKVNTDELQN